MAKDYKKVKIRKVELYIFYCPCCGSRNYIDDPMADLVECENCGTSFYVEGTTKVEDDDGL